ncbi:hypothetical protein BDV93DRAFT_513028 [Ceratobasidium sp. AG-I]|nr:hypothetical protein BDV93DRAFT_513028 [Ceratobasidium sp. AG-I]
MAIVQGRSERVTRFHEAESFPDTREMPITSTPLERVTRFGHAVHPRPKSGQTLLSAVPWKSTLASELESLATLTLPDQVLRCRSVKLGDKSSVSVEDFVLVKTNGTSSGNATCDNRSLVQVHKIVANSLTRTVVCIVVRPFEIGSLVLPYCFPSVSQSNKPDLIVEFPSRQRRQERQSLDSYEDELQHSSQPGDLAPNLAQLRSAQSIHSFYPNVPSIGISRREAMERGLAFQAEQECKRKADQEAKDATALERAKKKEQKEER